MTKVLTHAFDQFWRPLWVLAPPKKSSLGGPWPPGPPCQHATAQNNIKTLGKRIRVDGVWEWSGSTCQNYVSHSKIQRLYFHLRLGSFSSFTFMCISISLSRLVRVCYSKETSLPIKLDFRHYLTRRKMSCARHFSFVFWASVWNEVENYSI